VWGSLVYRRFCVNPKQSRARAHGGTSWKDAFRAMSLTHRVPTCHYTRAEKAIFAQGSGGNPRDHVSSWVLVSHTANCRTKRSNYHSSTRFIKFHVCLQNIKSGAGSVQINVKGATFTGVYGENRMYGKPMILYRSTQDVPTVEAYSLDHDEVLVLAPFEFCVIAMTFPCGVAVFETDVLRHADYVCVPLADSDDVIKATFLPRNEVWKYYMLLPGEYLVLHEAGAY
jgi:hypothetical protein